MAIYVNHSEVEKLLAELMRIVSSTNKTETLGVALKNEIARHKSQVSKSDKIALVQQKAKILFKI